MDHRTLKEEARTAIDAVSPELLELSRRIQSTPEIAYQEVQAAGWIADLLDKYGFQVTRGPGGVDTAFIATLRGKGPGPTVAVIAEYDALPGVGHGCGHNLIAAGAVGAALGLRELMPRLDGVLKVFGTPAEESTSDPGGKIRLLESGVFEGVDACIMFHPWTATQLVEGDLAVTALDISFEGQAAHAAADPWKGANALDGVLLTYMNVNALRQHVKSDVRIHGIVTHGGDAANVIPDKASARFAVRSLDKNYLQEVVSRVEDCARGAALATKTQVTVKKLLTLENTLSNHVLRDVVKANLEAEGIDFEEELFLPGSTDFGNLSQQVPAFWFMLKTHRTGLTWHSQDVAEEAVSEEAHAATIAGAKVLALSCLDLFLQPGLLTRARQEFDRRAGVS
ncbi:MAG TPA: M20 family peptidase [Chloroflexi bacterium]|nr:M20 family peptidase [Chloroflexota bacterium]